MSEAKWKLMVDWQGDGEFAGAGDDITPATLHLSLRHMRDIATEYIKAARLDVSLANSDHKYSPPNAASSLFGKLKPGRKVWLLAAFPLDDFSTPNASLSDHTPEYGAAYRWSQLNQDFHITAQGSVQTNGDHAGKRIATQNFALADVSFGCYFTRGNNSARHGGIAIRYADDRNLLYLRITGAALQVRKVEQGSDTLLAQTALQWNSGEQRFLQVALHGDSIRIFVNQKQTIVTHSDFNSNSARHGLYSDGAADHIWQQFGGWTSLFYGDLHSIDPQPNEERCHIRAFDEMRRLETATLYMYATSSFPQTSDDVLRDILNYAGVDPAFRRLDVGAQLVPNLWSPPLWGVQAADEIQRLQDEEDGFIYVDGHGCWQLENRLHRATTTHAAPKASLTARSDGNHAYFSALHWTDGAGNIENKLFMRIRDAANHGHRTAWTLGETPYFEAGETRDFLAESNDFDVVGGQLAPIPNTDYTANTQPSGDGDNITSQLSVTLPATNLYNGKGTLIRVRFGNSPGYLTRLAMRTVNALTFNAPLLVTAENAASQSAYGQRIRSIEARWTRQAHSAQTTLAARLARKASPRTTLAIALPNGSDANIMLALQARLSDRLAVSYDDMGVDGDFFIEGHRLEVSDGWQRVQRTLLLQAV